MKDGNERGERRIPAEGIGAASEAVPPYRVLDII